VTFNFATYISASSEPLVRFVLNITSHIWDISISTGDSCDDIYLFTPIQFSRNQKEAWYPDFHCWSIEALIFPGGLLFKTVSILENYYQSMNLSISEVEAQLLSDQWSWYRPLLCYQELLFYCFVVGDFQDVTQSPKIRCLELAVFIGLRIGCYFLPLSCEPLHKVNIPASRHWLRLDYWY